MDLTGAPVDVKLPILETFVATHGIEQLTWRTVWSDSKVKNFKLGQWVNHLKANQVKLTPAQRQRVAACGVKPRALATRKKNTDQDQKILQTGKFGTRSGSSKTTICKIVVDWDEWFKASMPQRFAMLSKHYQQLCLLNRKNWYGSDFVHKFVIFAHYVEQNGTTHVKSSYVDPGTNFHLGSYIGKVQSGYNKLNPDEMDKLNALGFIWNTKASSKQAARRHSSSPIQSEAAMNAEEPTKSSKRKREKPDHYTPGPYEPFSNDLNDDDDNDDNNVKNDNDDNESEESSFCMPPTAKACKGEEPGDNLSQLKGEDDGDDLSRLAEKFTTRTELDSRIAYIRETLKKASHSIEVDLIEQAMELQKELEPLQSLRGWERFRSVEELERDAVLVKQELQAIDGNMACLHKRCELAKRHKYLQDRIALEKQKAGEHPANPVCYC